MKKFAMVFMLSIVLALCGCGSTPSIDVVQEGPYGEIKISLPEGWSYETYAADNDSEYATYGIHFYPENATDGYVDISYTDAFGVCGTGLVVQVTTLAGNSAEIGTYGNNDYWSYISFRGEYKGLVATTYDVMDWWDGYDEQVLDILDTLSFSPNVDEAAQ